jgi:IS5 family transposase
MAPSSALLRREHFNVTTANDRLDAIFDRIERLKAGIRAKVEHPFRILKRQFGYTKTRYRALMKNNAQITTLFALGNLWIARRAPRKA